MRSRPTLHRGPSTSFVVFSTLGLLLIGIGGTLGTLVALGHLELPWIRKPVVGAAVPAKPIETHEGEVACVVLGRPLKAYGKVARDDLADPKNGGLAVVWMPREAVDPNWLREPGQVIGRVLGRDKAPGYIFTEKDFLPLGTREGVTAGIPSGKMALSVRTEQVAGLHVLKPGDRFDLLAAVPIDLKEQLPQLQLGLGNDALEGRDQVLGHLQRQATTQVVVENGVLVSMTPTGSAATNVAPPSKSLAEKITRPAGSEGAVAAATSSASFEAVIAVGPQEIVPLTKSLHLGHGVTCIARSGRPDEAPPANSHASSAAVKIPEDESPLKHLAVIERIDSQGRKVEVFVTSYPRSKVEGKEEASAADAPDAPQSAPSEVRESKPSADRQSHRGAPGAPPSS